MRAKKILYFDYWTVGINNFAFFDDKLKAKGFDTKLLHLGSWRKTGEPDFQNVRGIDCFDIRYYKTNLIFKVLKKEQPSVVIMLNASFITDRTVILACKKLGIKVVYLSHGVLTREHFIQETIDSMNIARRKSRISSALKHLRGTVWNYFYSLLRYDWSYLLKTYPYFLVLNSFFNPGKYLICPPKSFDLEPDLALVYSNAEEKFFRDRFGKPSSVKAIGIPDLDSYFQQLNTLSCDKESFYRENNLPTSKPLVTYIEEGLVVDKFWDAEYRTNFLREIIDMCSEAGYHLVIKLHPRTTASPDRSLFDNLGNSVTILEQTNFPKLVYFSAICVSHYSTTLIYPMLLDKPILVPRWGKSGELLTLYSSKEVTFVQTKEEFKRYLKEINFDYDRHEYLNDLVPFTDGRTSDRITKYVIDLIQ